MPDSENGPDWFIDPTQPPHQPQADARLPVVAETIRAAQSQLRSIVSLVNSMEEVVRDCAANGTTRGEIAVQCSLTGEEVDRVLAGGTLLDFRSNSHRR